MSDEACACLRVEYRTKLRDGVTGGWWACRDCSTAFVKPGAFDALYTRQDREIASLRAQRDELRAKAERGQDIGWYVGL